MSRINLILSSDLCLGLPKSLLPVGLPVKTLKALLPTCPFQSFIFDHPEYSRWTVQIMKFLLVEPSPLPIRILLGPNIRLWILFSSTLILHSSLNVRDHVSESHSTTGNIVLFILIFKFLSYTLVKNLSSIRDRTSASSCCTSSGNTSIHQ